MVAKDTVMRIYECLQNSDWDEGGGYFAESVAKALVEQAEISFKAGIKEVVEWIDTHQSCDITQVTFDRKSVEPCVLIKNSGWQAKLKDWGIK